EELDPTGTKVNFNGSLVDIIEVQHTYKVANSADVTETIRIVPHHGPIIEWDPANNRAVSMRWTGHQADTDFDAFFGLARAKSVAEAKAALENATTVNQNFVVIDDQNNIGWFPYSRVPVRPWSNLETPSWMPVPGTGGYEWEGFMDYADLPQLENPPAGFIATANQDMSGALVDGDPTNDGYNMLQIFPAKGYRHERILQLLTSGETGLTGDDLVAIQGDTLVLAGQGIVPVVLNELSLFDGVLDADQQRVVDALQAWNYTCPTGLATNDPEGAVSADAGEVSEALGCTVFHVLLDTLTEKLFADDVMGSSASVRSMYSATYVQLTNPELFGETTFDYFDNVLTPNVQEGRLDTILAAITEAGQRLKNAHTTDTSKWLWGRLHTLELKADLLSAVVATYNNGTYAAPGGQWTVNVANPANVSDDNFTFGAGPSMRLVAEVTDNGIVSRISFPGGQRHFRDNAFYDNLLDGWLKNEPIDLLFGSAAVDAAATETDEILPAP
ncbi:MAG: penicillin acylase family protein, partial [bacterium]